MHGPLNVKFHPLFLQAYSNNLPPPQKKRKRKRKRKKERNKEKKKERRNLGTKVIGITLFLSV